MLETTYKQYNNINWPNRKDKPPMDLCQLQVQHQDFPSYQELHRHLMTCDLGLGWIELQSQVRALTDAKSQWQFTNDNQVLQGEFASNDANIGWRFLYMGNAQWRLTQISESTTDTTGEIYLAQDFNYLARKDSELGELQYRVYWQPIDNHMQTVQARFVDYKTANSWNSN